QIINENGSDGTVRPAAANLNAVGMTVDFSGGSESPEGQVWPSRSGDAQFPFAVLPDRDHSTIYQPATLSGAREAVSQRLGELIVAALECDAPDAYRTLCSQWQQISEETAGLSRDEAALKAAFPNDAPDPQMLHQYLQVVTVVRDDQGQHVD